MDQYRSEFEQLRLADLALVAGLARARNFTRVAQELGIARSSASRRLAEIEGRLGIQLFERTTRHVAPTPAGERFLVHAVPALQAARDAVDSAVEATGLRGTLVVSSPPVLGGLVVTPAVVDLLETHPDSRVEMHTEARFADLELEGVDVALRLGTDGRAGEGEVLGFTPFVLVSARERATLDDREVLGASRFAISRGRQERTIVPAGRLRTSDYSALLDAVRSGLGVTRLPRPMVRSDLLSGALVEVLPDWSAGRQAIRLIQRNRRLLATELVDRIRRSPVLPHLIEGQVLAGA